MSSIADENDPHPLYNTAYNLHRLSPLYTGSYSPFTSSQLEKYARSLRDILAGEVLRGVRVGLADDDDSTLARVGGLQSVTWSFLPEDVNLHM